MWRKNAIKRRFAETDSDHNGEIQQVEPDTDNEKENQVISYRIDWATQETQAENPNCCMAKNNDDKMWQARHPNRKT